MPLKTGVFFASNKIRKIRTDISIISKYPENAEDISALSSLCGDIRNWAMLYNVKNKNHKKDMSLI